MTHWIYAFQGYRIWQPEIVQVNKSQSSLSPSKAYKFSKIIKIEQKANMHKYTR